MQIDVRFTRLQPSAALAQHAQRRILFALDRFQPQIARVSIRLQDTNGPRGGVDKSCSVEVALLQGGTVRLDEIGEDAYAVVDRAAARLRHSVARTLERAHPRSGPSLATLPLADERKAG
ncbi:HPF/RaiA family ribosome-associated protein [Vulgatibacter sp.]|uniref:HPF/RaiA family ribosome-associated protein n=1 Tax=Vulgatibacter sp. TaxID=1971226 RepID=UPI003566E7B2